MLGESLSHPNNAIRADALALLCQPTKTSLPVSHLHARLIRDFLVYNINIDCSIFRLALIKSFRVLSTRLRDTSCKHAVKVKSYYDLTCVHEDLLVSSKLVVWFVRFLHKQLLCEGNYQRKIISLQLLNEILTAFSLSRHNSKSFKPKAIDAAIMFIDAVSSKDEWYLQEYITPHHEINDNFHPLPWFNSIENPRASKEVFSNNIPRTSLYHLTLPQTVPLLLDLLKHGMNDVREESECLLGKINKEVWLQFYHPSSHHVTGFPLVSSSDKEHTSENEKDQTSSHLINGIKDSSVLELKFESVFLNIEDKFLSMGLGHSSSLVGSLPNGSCYADNANSLTDQKELPQTGVFYSLIKEAVDLLNCPKMSEAESGALKLRVLVTTLTRLGSTGDRLSDKVIYGYIEQ